MGYEIERKTVEPLMVAFVTSKACVAEMPQRMGEAFQRVYECTTRVDAQPEGPAFAQYLSMEEPFEFRAGFPVARKFEPGNGVEVSELPGGEVISTIHLGPYDRLEEAYEALMAYARENGLQPGDSMWEFYWNDPQTTDPEDLKTEIVMPLRRSETV